MLHSPDENRQSGCNAAICNSKTNRRKLMIMQISSLASWAIGRLLVFWWHPLPHIMVRWADSARKLHDEWWQSRIARQKEIDASIAAKAVPTFLYD